MPIQSVPKVGSSARRVSILLVVLVAGLCGCSPSEDGSETPAPSETTGTVEAASLNPELRDELLGMLRRDQRERTGGPVDEGDEARTERLKEIIEQHGWPTIDLVGGKAEDAAWAIAQHSDHDPDFQRDAVELLRDAVAAGDASPGNLAYLEDRVAVASGEPQVYGTQVGCSPNGPEPATPIKDEAGLDERRAEAGLDPMADYLAEMTKICAQVG